MRIIYIHHGLRELGNPPSENDKLLPLGEKDAENTAYFMQLMTKKHNLKAIYTSPFFRCQRTAEIVNQFANVPIVQDSRLNEFKNVFHLVSGNELNQKAESWLACQLRIRDLIKELVFTYDDNDAVVCVTSGVNITAFISVAYKVEPSNDLPFPMVPSCSPIAFDIDKTFFQNKK